MQFCTKNMLLELCPEWPEKWSQSIKFPKNSLGWGGGGGGGIPPDPQPTTHNWRAYAHFPPGKCLALPLHFSLLRAWQNIIG